MSDTDDPDIDFDEPSGTRAKAKRTEFDCPECSANNPYDDGFVAGDEIRCYYCGEEFLVDVNLDGKWKFRLM
jgi:DNA-directed RNA polymerase subunit RPC12/RpoP